MRRLLPFAVLVFVVVARRRERLGPLVVGAATA